MGLNKLQSNGMKSLMELFFQIDLKLMNQISACTHDSLMESGP